MQPAPVEMSCKFRRINVAIHDHRRFFLMSGYTNADGGDSWCAMEELRDLHRWCQKGSLFALWCITCQKCN